MAFLCQAEKKSQVSGNRSGENFLSLTRRHSQMCIRIYIFNFYKKEEKKKKDSICGKPDGI